jgi:hypothetical protein
MRGRYWPLGIEKCVCVEFYSAQNPADLFRIFTLSPEPLKETELRLVCTLQDVLQWRGFVVGELVEQIVRIVLNHDDLSMVSAHERFIALVVEKRGEG